MLIIKLSIILFVCYIIFICMYYIGIGAILLMILFMYWRIYRLLQYKGKIAEGQRALMTLKLREKIKQRDNYTCCKCGLSITDERNLLLEIDHIIPLSKDDMSEEENLQTLCWKCNRKKGVKIEN